MSQQAALAPADELRTILQAPETSEEATLDLVAPQLVRYIFSPFCELELTSILARHSGFVVVPKQLIFPCKTVSYMDTNYAAVGLSELLDESQSVNQKREKRFVRSAKTVAESLVREFGGQGEKVTGVCELVPLAGVEDVQLIIDLQTFFFPQRFSKVEVQLSHLYECQQQIEQDGMADPFGPVAAALILSTETAKIYYEDRLDTSKSSIEERANGGFGKRQPSSLDLAICAWLDVVPPRRLSKLDLGKSEEKAQTPIIVQAAPAATDGLEREQCQACGEMVPLINGNLPKVCRFCKGNPSGAHKVKAATGKKGGKPAAQAPKETETAAPAE